MTYLIDTHTLLWIVTNNQKLSVKAKKIYFSTDKDIDVGAVINCDTLYLNTIKYKKLKIDVSKCHLKGRHNYENIAAASLAAISAGGNIDGIKAAVENVKGLPHRLEYVATVDEVQYFDDSKATNIGANKGPGNV